MSISKRQFNLLQAMGITLWQRRDLSSQNSSITASVDNNKNIEGTSVAINTSDEHLSEKTQQQITPQVACNKPTHIELKTLFKQQLFNDIIRCLGASSADISIDKDQIDLGIINWQFTDNDNIEFKHNCLKTPDLTTLANSPALKKALWQSIGPLSSI